MIMTVSAIARSLATYLCPYFEGVTFYENPNQQGTKTPCMFLQQMYANIKPEISGLYMRRIGLDLTYLLKYNLPDLQSRYQEAAEKLDILMETFPYADEETDDVLLIRTYDRQWRVDIEAMHYKFEIKERVYIPKTYAKMEHIEEYNEVIKIETCV